ncbi:MAG TPA: porin family protein [Burkholderiales bacterium]|nr:porin family protein [Burkholderiales bacterium]
MQRSRLITHSFTVGALTLAAALSPSAQAQLSGITDETTGFYVGAGVGGSSLDNPCPSGSHCDDHGTVWKIYGGWQLNKWLSAELGYMNFPDVDFRGSVAGAPYKGSVDTWGISGFAVGRLPIPIGAFDRVSLLGKIGTLYYDRERHSTFGPFRGSDNGFAFAWGLGAQYTFSERLGLRAEWERFENVGDSHSGKGDINAYTFSVNYKF